MFARHLIRLVRYDKSSDLLNGGGGTPNIDLVLLKSGRREQSATGRLRTEAAPPPSAGGGTVPLSEHEQRMLDQIESALYAEDPKFASSVRGGRLRAATSRRRLQAAALFVLGLVLLIAGVALPVKPGGFPIISLVGFAVMFGAGVLLIMGNSRGGAKADAARGGPSDDSGRGKPKGPGPGRARGPRNKSGGFSSRMEDRFRRRFEQE